MADATFRDVVEQVVHEEAAKAGARTDVVVGEFVLIATANGWDEEGHDVSQVIVMPDGGSESRILGLVEHARLRMHADVLSGYE
jgi:hypothetical protein